MVVFGSIGLAVLKKHMIVKGEDVNGEHWKEEHVYKNEKWDSYNSTELDCYGPEKND